MYLNKNLFNVTLTGSNKCKRVIIGDLRNIGGVGDEKAILRSDTAWIHPHPFQWNNVFNVDGHSFRMVHFVREPFDMVISGYLYHRQVPFPAPEKFLVNTGYDPCEFDSKLQSLYIPSLIEFTKNTTNISHMVDRVVQMCKSLQARYPAKNFNKQLNIAKVGTDLLDGIRLEACRALLSKSNGDILKMGFNTLQEVAYLKDHSNLVVRRTFTSEFPVTNMTVFHNSTMNVMKFLMQPTNSPNVFYNCIKEDEAVRYTLQNAFAELPSTYSSTPENTVVIAAETDKREHITSDQLTHEERASYIHRLEQDPVLAPLLMIVRQIVFGQKYTPIKW